ncbi:hypothetical protein V8E55_011280 [Tylopilus felleus]
MIGDLLSALSKHAELANMSYSALDIFIHCANQLKNDILLPQPQSISHLEPPLVLPPSIAGFLANVSGISPALVDCLWVIVQNLVWSLPLQDQEDLWEEEVFERYEHLLVIGMSILPFSRHTFYSPTDCCTNSECSTRSTSTLLKKEEQRHVVVFTLSDGAHPGWSVHLRCHACHTNYHHNYSVHGNVRTYYPGTPTFLQVAEHQFIQRELVLQWIDLMQVVVSATNCAHLYSISEVHRASNFKMPWQFSMSLTTEEVWDAFCLQSLLEDHDMRRRLIIHGQEELPHACDSCVRIFEEPDGIATKTEVVVTNGVTIGRPCCAVLQCKNALESNHHRFCAAHRARESICTVEGCDQPVKKDGLSVHKACNDPLHLHMELLNLESMQHEKSKGQRDRISKLDDMLHAVNNVATHDIPLQDGDTWYEHDQCNGAVHIIQPAKTTSTGISDSPAAPPQMTPQCPNKTAPKKLKAVFRRQRTNNEQLVVRPCGIINGRATMYNHEVVSNVLIFIEQLYSLPQARKPEHLIYDSNCNALREVMSQGISFFSEMGMCVDAFHHKTKHKTSDTFCQEWCNMKSYPELLDDHGKYFFNLSIAEQTNVWFGAFHNICREMTAVKYDFFWMRCSSMDVLPLISHRIKVDPTTTLRMPMLDILLANELADAHPMLAMIINVERTNLTWK